MLCRNHCPTRVKPWSLFFSALFHPSLPMTGYILRLSMSESGAPGRMIRENGAMVKFEHFPSKMCKPRCVVDVLITSAIWTEIPWVGILQSAFYARQDVRCRWYQIVMSSDAQTDAFDLSRFLALPCLEGMDSEWPGRCNTSPVIHRCFRTCTKVLRMEMPMHGTLMALSTVSSSWLSVRLIPSCSHREWS